MNPHAPATPTENRLSETGMTPPPPDGSAGAFLRRFELPPSRRAMPDKMADEMEDPPVPRLRRADRLPYLLEISQLCTPHLKLPTYERPLFAILA